MAKVSLQFHTDLKEYKKDLANVVRLKFNRLRKRYDEILSATVNLDKGEKDDTPYQLKSTVILKTKLKNFVATKVEKMPLKAIRESFDAAERQIRKYLDKISHRWEKHNNGKLH